MVKTNSTIMLRIPVLRKTGLKIPFSIGKYFLIWFLFLPFRNLVAQSPDLFLTSFQNDAISRFNTETGTFLGYFVSPGAGGLDRPQDVFFHPVSGHLLVTGFLNNQIKMYDGQNGNFLSNFSSGYSLNNPTKMILGPDSLLYVSQWDGRVVRFTLEGNFVDEFTSINIPAGLGMTWDEDDNLYVTSWGNDGFDGQVYKFDMQGDSQGAFINSAMLDGPVGIWRDESGDFFVVDWRLGSVLQFDSNGNFEGIFISGTERIEGHAFGSDGTILLCNVQINQVKCYNPDGSFQEICIDDNNLAGPNALSFGPAITPLNNLGIQKPIDIHAYPNPGYHKVFIEFHLTTASFLTLSIINNTGQEIAVLNKGVMESGKQLLTWNITGIPSGIYFLQMNIGNEIFTEPLILSPQN